MVVAVTAAMTAAAPQRPTYRRCLPDARQEEALPPPQVDGLVHTRDSTASVKGLVRRPWSRARGLDLRAAHLKGISDSRKRKE
eukprot:3546731-Prymnesium_polylepis.2